MVKRRNKFQIKMDILRIIRAHPMGIAKSRVVTSAKSNMTSGFSLVESLQKSGLVEISPHGKSERTHIVEITTKGIDAITLYQKLNNLLGSGNGALTVV